MIKCVSAKKKKKKNEEKTKVYLSNVISPIKRDYFCKKASDFGIECVHTWLLRPLVVIGGYSPSTKKSKLCNLGLCCQTCYRPARSH